MEEKTIHLTMDGKQFLITNIDFSNDGVLSYDLSCVHEITEEDRKHINDYFRKVINDAVSSYNHQNCFIT